MSHNCYIFFCHPFRCSYNLLRISRGPFTCCSNDWSYLHRSAPFLQCLIQFSSLLPSFRPTCSLQDSRHPYYRPYHSSTSPDLPHVLSILSLHLDSHHIHIRRHFSGILSFHQLPGEGLCRRTFSQKKLEGHSIDYRHYRLFRFVHWNGRKYSKG